GYLREPAGISESIIRDLEEAVALMKQIHDANTDKPSIQSAPDKSFTVTDAVSDKVYIPHLNQSGTVTQVLQEGRVLRIMTNLGQAIQTRTIDTTPIYKEESKILQS